jgi:hypothetical protein
MYKTAVIREGMNTYIQRILACGSAERKYLVVIFLKYTNAYYVEAVNHEEALQAALRLYKLGPCPQVGIAECCAYGLCNDRNCDCGHAPALVSRFETLG